MNMLDYTHLMQRVGDLHPSYRAVVIVSMDCGNDITVGSYGHPDDIQYLKDYIKEVSQ